MKKLLLSLIVLTMLVAFGVTQAEAVNPAQINVTVTVTASALSVAVSPTSWGAGILDEGLSATTGTEGYFDVENDSTNVTEDFSIVTLHSTNWLAGGTAGDEVFVMEALGGDLDTLTSIHASQTLETGVAPGGIVGDLDLKVTVPTTTVFGGVEQLIRVQIAATATVTP